ncbi:Protein CBFA2T2, partial [Dissostichus eleginoides]
YMKCNAVGADVDLLFFCLSAESGDAALIPSTQSHMDHLNKLSEEETVREEEEEE